MTNTATSFDAIEAARKLRTKGIDPEHAEAIAHTISEANAATVTDAVGLFRYELTQLRSEMHNDIATIHVKLQATMIKLATLIIAVMGICSAIVIAVLKYTS